MPFLAIDAGNSSVKAAVWDGEWSPVARFPSDEASAEEWAERLESAGRADRAGIASVVPTLTPRLVEAAARVVGRAPVVVSVRLGGLPVRVAYATPGTLGADRIAAAVAAHALADGRAVLAIDAGTAITTEVVTADGTYLGGAILPGPDLLRRALHRDTGQLPEVPWPETLRPVGDSTVGAIQAGLGVLLADGIAGLIGRTENTLHADSLVVATGGWANWLARHVAVDRVEPTLVLDGIRLIGESANR